MTVVLDSWALLRYLNTTEPAAVAVAELLGRERPLPSWINLGEWYDVLRREHGDRAARETVRQPRHEVTAELPTQARVMEAARLKDDHRMSYADAFAGATAIAHGADLWSGEPELLVADAPWRWRDLR